jgi:hypothetical protein
MLASHFAAASSTALDVDVPARRDPRDEESGFEINNDALGPPVSEMVRFTAAYRTPAGPCS